VVHRFGIVLMIAALFGLFGQETVFARALPDVAMSRSLTTASVPMDPACAELMGLTKAQPKHPEKPCEGKTLDCMAKMGCSVPVVLLPAAAAEDYLSADAPTPSTPAARRLNGLEYGPEPDPPTYLR
jgi:hypothetical protein